MIRCLLLVLAMLCTPRMVAAEPAAESAELIRTATALLLDGASLPPDFPLRLAQLPPSERMGVLVFLRRSGLLTGPAWTVERILAAPITAEAGQ